MAPALFVWMLVGCTRNAAPTAAEARALAAEQRQEAELARQQMERIAPPSKTKYLAVKSLLVWENPYLTVQGEMVTLHVTAADANKSDMGVGGILRPVGARRQVLNVRMGDLGTALNAVPADWWPYGRVVAVEEAHDIPVRDQPEVRRNLETVVRTLNDLGVVVYEWGDNGKG